ncbi:FMN-dependent NADH-azoreductase [Clostridium lundense]|uniref:FMN-dependent NADH-azoreductase n=1 Tax=Clostridium lundense TaxID=319475 RepID=UPI00048089FF|nr:FMN-dependent NADH-azoreductase [Clostridium lundense]
MSKVLYIKANIKPEGMSRTFKISDNFVDQYKKLNPNDKVTTLDLYKENINFLRGEDLNSIFGPKTDESRNHSILKYAYQFAEADKYIIAAPMWNLSIPAILKAYIDYVSVSGVTFKYAAEGPVGLCHGKKAIHIVARGGSYSEGPAVAYEMGDRYLRTIFGFFGITDFSTISAEKLDVMGENVEVIVGSAIKKAQEKVKEF